MYKKRETVPIELTTA